MNINSENCEAWFLDFYEGNLSKEGVDELFAFLVLNPEMRDLFDSYEDVSFSPEKHIKFDWKSELKKPMDVVVGINESNYGEYFVSHVEGLLNANEEAEVEKFLLQFPEKRVELELVQQAILIPDEHIVFEHKSSLQKSVLVSAENFDEMAIASVEGLLNSEEEKELAASLSANAAQQKNYALYKQTKLSADASIVFEDKESLKRKDRGAFWWIIDTRFAAAAAVALLIGIFFWNYSGEDAIDTIAANDRIDSANIAKSTPKSTPKTNPVIAPVNPSQNPVAVAPENNSQKENVEVVIPKKQIATIDAVPVLVKNTKEPMALISTSNEKLSLSTNVNPRVDFSDTYYSTAIYSKTASAETSPTASISPRQAAMRWMKKKLDRAPVNEEEDATYIAANTINKNENVSGFDLTSSAVAALGSVTGSNLRLGHEPEGTVLTIGKYELLLNRNK